MQMLPISNILFKSLLCHRNLFPFSQSIFKLRKQKQASIAKKIKAGLQASFVSVTDTTRGPYSCGEMYEIVVQSPLFEKKSKLDQQRMVNELLKEEVKSIHGYSLKTRIPKKNQFDSNVKTDDENKN